MKSKKTRIQKCRWCGRKVAIQRITRKWCGPACSQAAYRARRISKKLEGVLPRSMLRNMGL